MLDISIGIIKKVIHFKGKTPSFYNMTYIQIFHNYEFFNKSTYSFVV